VRTSSVIGAPSLRRLASGALVVGLLATGLATLAAAPASALASTAGRHGDGHVGERWDGGRARTGGVEYSWAPRTFDYVGNTCPELDSGKIDTRGESPTVVISAPEGTLISSYCIKSGSDNTGEGPKVVELDEPVKSLTIAYPVDGKCKSISHYAVEYVDAGRPTSPPAAETTVPGGDETPATPDDETLPPAVAQTPAPPAGADQPGDETPGSDQPGGEQPGDEQPGDGPQGETSSVVAEHVASRDETPAGAAPAVAAVTVPAPSPSAEPSTAASVAALPGDDAPSAAPRDRRLAATDASPVVPATGRLAFTGAQVAGVLVAAVVLVALGTLAVHAARRRASARR
jgi:hypothetical protein